tara:strand:- start:48551 stop:48655 length:105 start_codon:yes stop_codon:yes gene_type:complete
MCGLLKNKLLKKNAFWETPAQYKINLNNPIIANQ